MEKVKILVLFYGYSSIVELAKEIAKGAEVRIKRVREILPPEIKVPLDKAKDIPEATLNDLRWADGLIIGSPTRYGRGIKDVFRPNCCFMEGKCAIWQASGLFH